MTILRIGSSTFVTETATDSAELAVPEGATAGRLMLAALKRNLDGETITPPAGWELLDSGEVNTGWTAVYFRFAEADEPSSYTWGFSGFTLVRGDIHVYAGVATIARHTLAQNTTNLTSYDSAPVHADAGEWLLTIVGGRSEVTGTGVSWSTDAELDAERTDLSSERDSGHDISMASWDSDGGVALTADYDRTLTATTTMSHAQVWHLVLTPEEFVSWSPDYVSASELADFLKIDDAVDDVQLALAVSAASRAVDTHTNRQFGKVDSVEERVYEPEWDRRRRRWLVSIDDLMTETGLVVTGKSGPITDYTLVPRNAAQKGRPWTGFTVETKPGEEVTVEALWGWTTVPDAIKQATLLQASRLFNRRTSPYGVAGSPELGAELRLLARVDPDVAVTLNPYIRWWGAV